MSGNASVWNISFVPPALSVIVAEKFILKLGGGVGGMIERAIYTQYPLQPLNWFLSVSSE